MVGSDSAGFSKQRFTATGHLHDTTQVLTVSTDFSQTQLDGMDIFLTAGDSNRS